MSKEAMSGRHSKQDPAVPGSKTSWFKSKAAKAFSSSTFSKPVSPSTGTSAAKRSDATSSVDKASNKLPLRDGQSQPGTGKPTAKRKAETLISRPISELWDEAYEELSKKDKGLVPDYEIRSYFLSPLEMTNIVNALSTIFGP
jgi:hypothetical protein